MTLEGLVCRGCCLKLFPVDGGGRDGCAHGCGEAVVVVCEGMGGTVRAGSSGRWSLVGVLVPDG